MTLLKTSELQLADEVTRDGTEGTVVVKQIDEKGVHFFRTYPHTADFSYTGGVICYVGFEEWIEEDDRQNACWTLIRRKKLR